MRRSLQVWQTAVAVAALGLNAAGCERQRAPQPTPETAASGGTPTAYMAPTAADRHSDSLTAQRLIGVWHGSETGKGPLARGVIRFAPGGRFSARFWQSAGALRAPAQGVYEVFQHKLGISSGQDFDARFTVQFLDSVHVVLTSAPPTKAWPQFIGVADTLRRANAE